jgi:DNA-binding CsgD family transcriptional regulator
LGLSEKANHEFNTHYKYHVPFLPKPSFPLTPKEMLLHDAVCWNDYWQSEFACDFAKPNDMVYTLAKFIQEGCISFSINRSRIGGAFREADCLTLTIATQHINNIYTLFERAAIARGWFPSNDELADLFPALTRRESEVFELLIRGHAFPEIASKLFISERTVESHVAHIYEKIDVHSKREAVNKVQIMSGHVPPC